jgi:hypothetical protein
VWCHLSQAIGTQGGDVLASALNAAVYHASFYACSVDSACRPSAGTGRQRRRRRGAGRLHRVVPGVAGAHLDLPVFLIWIFPGVRFLCQLIEAGTAASCWLQGKKDAGDEDAARSRIRYSQY